jgi:glycosyltransferase involved in cell wall biosynthesis
MRIAHVTLYPPKNEKHVSSSGVASYSKNLVTHLNDKSDEQFVVCNMIDGKAETYREDNVSVRRVFERSPGFIFQIHRALKTINPDVVHVQQELALFGGVLTAYLLQWLLLVWRKKVVITLHGVVDPRKIDATFIKENNSKAPVWLVRLAFRIIYTPLFWWSDRVIVHELYFKDIAVKAYGADADKVAVVHHGVEIFTTMDSQVARRELNLPESVDIVYFMGYATGYKGIDLLIEGFSKYADDNPNAYLVLGAGKHPKLHQDATYLREYQRLQDKAEALIPTGQYTWRGFIKEPEVRAYYSASDVSVYPYTTAMSSSGPMAFAIGYEKPFLVSSAFEDVFGDEPRLLFERDATSLADKLGYFFANKDEYSEQSRRLKTQRTWDHVGEQTHAVYQDIDDRKGKYETENSPTAG